MDLSPTNDASLLNAWNFARRSLLNLKQVVQSMTRTQYMVRGHLERVAGMPLKQKRRFLIWKDQGAHWPIETISIERREIVRSNFEYHGIPVLLRPDDEDLVHWCHGTNCEADAVARYRRTLIRSGSSRLDSAR